ncbi:MAG: DeoR/GlpR family DNA-binding transcription regulator [Chthoniobacteraceae bacterium]|jgi:DeoR family fructose operon transcriptional repressor
MIDSTHIQCFLLSEMKVPLRIVSARREKLAAWLQQHSYVPLNEVCARFQISEATARRDLAALASGHQIRRTHGGALAEYSHRFPSFIERQRVSAAGKQAIARRAWSMIQPGNCCFFDAGTTIFAIAEELQRVPVTPLTAITNSLPVAELLAPVQGIGVHLLGGELLPFQAVLVGRAARMALEFYEIDLAFLGVQGADIEGVWNSQQEVVEFQKRLINDARQVVLCADATKLGRTAPVFLSHWKEIDHVLTDAPPPAARTAGVPQKFLSQPDTSPRK